MSFDPRALRRLAYSEYNSNGYIKFTIDVPGTARMLPLADAIQKLIVQYTAIQREDNLQNSNNDMKESPNSNNVGEESKEGYGTPVANSNNLESKEGYSKPAENISDEKNIEIFWKKVNDEPRKCRLSSGELRQACMAQNCTSFTHKDRLCRKHLKQLKRSKEAVIFEKPSPDVEKALKKSR
jgi:hypothetical protein